MVKVTVPPTAQFVTLNSKRPCANTAPERGRVGGTGGAPGGAAMNCGAVNVQAGAALTNEAVMFPLPVALGAV